MDKALSKIDRLPLQTGAVSRSGLHSGELQELVLAAQTPLRCLHGASLLVTGATGWFGVWLLDTLCAADDLLGLGLRIHALSRTPERFLARFPQFADDPRILWITADVRRPLPALRGFSHVIHAAADTSAAPGGGPTAEHLYDTIVEGTRRTLEAAGSECQSFLYLSSGAVYGPPQQNEVGFRETDAATETGAATEADAIADFEAGAITDRTAYGRGKRVAERLCADAAARGLPVRIARCFAFVGPHMPFDKHFAIGNFIADAVAGRTIRVKSDGRPLRSYMYMTDLMRALLLVLTAGRTGRAYNVGSDAAISIEGLAHRVDRNAGGAGVIIEGAASDPLDRYVPDTTRLRTELDFAPQVALDGAILRTAAWLHGSMATANIASHGARRT
jgi:dTDP-glucose 4,6-dehydratase